jgi:pimeloyl-ACP methyl ester carboxylesterase
MTSAVSGDRYFLLSGELGTVLFLHGFPEIWYSWCHQMLAVAAAGYRAVAPDWRGYGLSDQPPEAEAASYEDLQEDLLSLLDALSLPKVLASYPQLCDTSGEIIVS